MHDHPSRGAPARSRRWRRPRLAALVGVLAVGVAVAASGGGDKSDGVASLGGAGKTTPTTAAGGCSDRMQGALAWARCLRQHGVSMPDPKVTAEGIAQELPRGLDPGDPRVQAAEHACHQYGSLPPINGPHRGGGGT
jgi:hypothetical protein